jgi:hypothetical protein
MKTWNGPQKVSSKVVSKLKPACVSAGVCVGLALTLASQQAAADTIWREAESPRDTWSGTMTSPLLIKDSAAASNGSFIEVEGGNNSLANVPAQGQACYVFSVVDQPGNYKVWGRVMASNGDHDSFFVRMSSRNEAGDWVDGAWLRWNDIKLGNSWHWDFVHDDVNESTPILFPLVVGEHRLCLAYREDGTKLDSLLITSDGLDPRSGVSGAPVDFVADPANYEEEVKVSEGRASVLVSWRMVHGATSYTLQRRVGDWGESPWVTRQTGITNHSFVDSPTPGSYRYRVIAKNAMGSGAPSNEGIGQRLGTGEIYFNVGEPESLSMTAPMMVNAESDVEVAPGNNSLSEAPDTGTVRWDVRLGSAMTLRFWGIIVAPNKDSDSFWVRVDQGPWIKWNNIKPRDPNASCTWDVLHDSDNGDVPVKLSLGLGSHRIEVAYREEGTTLDRMLLTDDLQTSAAPGCFD